MKKLSIGTWPTSSTRRSRPTTSTRSCTSSRTSATRASNWAGSTPIPGPTLAETKEKRQKLRKEVSDHGLQFSALAADLWSQKLWSVEDSGPFIAAFAKNLIFAEDLGIDTIRVDTVEPVKKVKELGLPPKAAAGLIFARVAKAFDLCAKLAASRGVRICWEFEPGFPINKPSEIVELVGVVRDEMNNPNFGVLFDTCHAHMCAAVGPTRSARRRRCQAGPWRCWRSSRARSRTCT